MFQNKLTTHLIKPCLLVALAIGLYVPTLQHGYNLDDELVLYNPQKGYWQDAIAILSAPYFKSNSNHYNNAQYEYRPIAKLSFLIEDFLWQGNARHSHGVNLVLYALVGCLLFWFVRPFNPIVGWLAAGLFIAHPLHVEVVASLKNREEILALLFMLLGYMACWQYGKRRHLGWLGLGIFCLLIALLSKKTAWGGLVFLPLLFAYHYQANWRDYLLLVIASALVAWLFLPLPLLPASVVIIGLLGGWIGYYAWHNQGNQGNQGLSTKLLLHGSGVLILGLGFVMPNNWGLLIAMGLMAVGISIALSKRQEKWQYSAYWQAIGLVVFATVAYLYWLQQLLWVIAAITSIGWCVYGQKANNKQTGHWIKWSYGGLSLLTWGLAWMGTHWTSAAGAYVILGAGSTAWLWLFLKPTNTPKRQVRLGKIGVIGAGTVLVPTVLIAQGYSPLVGIIGLMMLCALVLGRGGTRDLGRIRLGAMLGTGFASFVLFVRQYCLAALVGLIGLIAGFYLVLRDQVNATNQLQHKQTYAQILQAKPPITQLSTQQAGRVLHFIENPLVNHDNWVYRSATGIHTLAHYLWMQVYPHPLSAYYGYAVFQARNWQDWRVWLAAGCCLALGIVGYFARNRHRWLTVCLLGTLLCLLPISNVVVLVAGGVADRLAFGASVFFCLAVAYGFSRLPKTYGYGLVVLVLVAYGLKSHHRAKLWKDRITLFAHDVKQYPQSAKLQQLAGDAYLVRGQKIGAGQASLANFQAAEQHLLASLALYDQIYDYHYSLGLALQLQNKIKEAIPYYENSIRHSPQWRADSYFNLGSCHERLGNTTQALAAYHTYLEHKPYELAGYANLVALYHRMKQYGLATQVALNATQRLPNNGDAWFNLAQLYYFTNRPNKALSALNMAEQYSRCTKNPRLNPRLCKGIQALKKYLITNRD